MTDRVDWLEKVREVTLWANGENVVDDTAIHA